MSRNVIVVPCFNEESRFNESYFTKLVSIKNTFWVFVDDGSTDTTTKKIMNFSKKKNVSCLLLKANVGKANAIAQGINYAFNEIEHIGWFGFLDCDGAFNFIDIENIINLANTSIIYDAIYSSRIKMSGRNIRRNKARHILGRMITSFFGLVWPDIPYDTQSGFKLYKYSDMFESIFIEPFKTKWFFDIELFIRHLKVQNRPMNVWEEPVNSWIDILGSKINYRHIVAIFFEIVYIFSLLANQSRNLKSTNKIDI